MTKPPPHPHRPVLEEDLGRLRTSVTQMGELVDGAIAQAMAGLASRDVDRCTAVIAEDTRVNALLRDVRELCFATPLTQTPLSCDLREMMGLLHMASELERMGDHCVSIAKLARDLAHQPELTSRVDLGAIGRACREQVRDILTAVVARSVEQAHGVAARHDGIDRAYREALDRLVQMHTTDPQSVYCATLLVFIAHHLERIADRVTNIAEDLIFLETLPGKVGEVAGEARVTDRGSRTEAKMVGGFLLDPAARTIRVYGEAVQLAPKEFELLSLLLAHPGHVLTRERIAQMVWGGHTTSNTISVHIRWLREKFERFEPPPLRIASVFGVGYRLDRLQGERVSVDG